MNEFFESIVDHDRYPASPNSMRNMIVKGKVKDLVKPTQSTMHDPLIKIQKDEEAETMHGQSVFKKPSTVNNFRNLSNRINLRNKTGYNSRTNNGSNLKSVKHKVKLNMSSPHIDLGLAKPSNQIVFSKNTKMPFTSVTAKTAQMNIDNYMNTKAVKSFDNREQNSSRFEKKLPDVK